MADKIKAEKICRDCEWWKEKDNSLVGNHCSNEKEYGGHPWIRFANSGCVNTDSFEAKK